MKGFKHEPIGPHVMLDTERCIVCTRCVRFCNEVTGTGELGVFQRGVRSYISAFPGGELDNAYSGNTVDICPVGALTLKEFRFRKRVWALKDVDSVCGSCARGCNVHLGTAENRIWRLTPRENLDVNKWWMCDEGRLSYQELYERPRLHGALTRKDGGTEPIDWPEALALLAGKLKEARADATVAVASASLTVEDLHVVKRLFAEAIGGGEIIVPESRRGEDDAILIRADKTPNAEGARLLGLGVDEGNRRLTAMLERARAGKVDVILLFGAGLAAHHLETLAAARESAFIAAFTPFTDGIARIADLVLPSAAYGEVDGTWVNFQGRAQRVRRALTPPGVALEGWRAASELMRLMGRETSYASWEDVLKEVASSVPRMGDVTPRRMSRQGVPV